MYCYKNNTKRIKKRTKDEGLLSIIMSSIKHHEAQMIHNETELNQQQKS